VPGMSLVKKAQARAEAGVEEINERVEMPMTRKLGVVDFFKETFKQMGEDHLGAFAGNLTYCGIFAIFPFLLFLISLLGIFHATALVDSLIKQASSTMPAEATKLTRDIAHSVTKSHSTGAFTVGAIISIGAALWGVSGACRAVMDAMNVMYDVKETRPTWKQYLIAILLSIGATALIVAALVLVVFGPALGGAIADRVGLGTAFAVAWIILQWPVLVAFVLLAFAAIYYFAPNVKQTFRFITPGSSIAVAVWLLFSLLFSLYVNNFGSYNKTYGTLAGVALLLLYMYYSAFFLLLGAEMNQVIEQHAPERALRKQGPHTPAPEPDGDWVDGDQPSTLKILRENRPRP